VVRKLKILKNFSFKNEKHTAWLNQYLKKSREKSNIRQKSFFQLLPIFEDVNEERFEQFVSSLPKDDAEAIVLLKRLKEAWAKQLTRSKDKSNGITHYPLNFTPQLKVELKKLAGKNSYQETIAGLITGAFQEEQKIRKKKNQEEALTLQNLKAIELSNELKAKNLQIIKLNDELKSKNEEIAKLHTELEALKSTSNKSLEPTSPEDGQPVKLTLTHRTRSTLRVKSKEEINQ
jgi:predicted RNase H-like nuclease (RuvC/YqgF family)